MKIIIPTNASDDHLLALAMQAAGMRFPETRMCDCCLIESEIEPGQTHCWICETQYPTKPDGDTTNPQ